jgi:SecD/SecF fusion protein
MDRKLTIRLVTILLILGLSLWKLYPTYEYFSKYRKLSAEEIAKLSDAERLRMRKVLEKSIRLGLDLQGGMHLVIELEESGLHGGARRDAQDRVMEILSTRVDQFGVTEPTIARQGDSRVLVQLPGIEDPDRAKGLIGAVAQLEFRMLPDAQETIRVIQAINEVLSKKPQAAAAAAADTAQTHAAADARVAAAADTSAHADSLFPELKTPEVKPDETNPFGSLFVDFRFGALYVPDDGARVQRVNEILKRDDVKAAIHATAPGTEFFWGSEEGPHTADGLPTKALFRVNTKVELTGDHLQDARVSPDPDHRGAMLVNFRLDRKGARTFSSLTAENVGKQLAIVLDGVVKSAPAIHGRIPSGEGQITGSFTDQQAKDLSIVLRAGALPVDLKFVEERTVGPTLGSDSLRRGLLGGAVGLGLSIVGLLIYYRFAGVLASMALLLNLVIVLAAMAVLRAALSMPGIAGLVLSVAMAVDANVLINERIREELRKAKTVTASIDAGYKGALSAIVDSNLTTIIAGIVLLYFGTGPVKGFAVTLCIGIVTSMFTALVVTRCGFDLFTRRRRVEKLWI